MQTLYKVLGAAKSIEEFSSAKVHNYQLELNDQIFQITDLERLPRQLRPSTLASPKSDTHMVFFSRHARLSNHFPASFAIGNHQYKTMEQFLAVRRAELSGNKDLIDKAYKAEDPVIAKHVLNALKGNHQQDWEQQVEEIALEGLRAKFGQNRQLRDYLCSTKQLILGEASRNTCWGIGMELSDPDVLDHSKWLESGNLLGRSLMKVRSELLQTKRKPTK